ncbi:hypothetical protein BJ878DRAFT_106351 [Calycina marina]|uniref:DNA polymerase lambda n=1 Tax=Calycina marina TaxID=1763456 RepID=A0A9P7Z9P1_9HELO|nr:hypothetical protein BJ878DRAFT_106351 [Calycina marina]
MAPMDADAAKVSFFKRLEALDDSSDDEEDTNDSKEKLAKSKTTAKQSPPILATPAKSSTAKKVPTLHRATSAPGENLSIVKETQTVSRKYNLRRVETVTPSGVDDSIAAKSSLMKKLPGMHRANPTPTSSINFVAETPPVLRKCQMHHAEIATPNGSEKSAVEETQLNPTPSGVPRPSSDRRIVSDPIFGPKFVPELHSLGIQTMIHKRKRWNNANESALLKNKKARKSDVKLLPNVKDHIFKGMIVYWIPPDEKDPVRKALIGRARERGAVWAQEFSAATTHIIVDKRRELTYNHVIAFLKVESLTESPIIVSDRYVIDCIQENYRLEERQNIYEVQPLGVAQEDTISHTVQSQTSNTSLQDKKYEHIRFEEHSPTETPPDSRSQPSAAKSPPEETVHLSLPDAASHSQNVPDVMFVSPFFGDELDEAIKQVRKEVELAIDEDSQDSEDECSQDDSDTDNNCHPQNFHQVSKVTKTQNKRVGCDQSTFSCMQGGTGRATAENPNRQTIEQLQKMCDYYGLTKNEWRHRAYLKIIGVLKKLDWKVCTYDEAIRLPGVGVRLAKKIEEIVLTGRLKRLDYTNKEPADIAMQLFVKIYGVGPCLGNHWAWQLGYRTLEDLKANVKLTDNQKMGIDRYDDLNTRIPRDEVSALGEIVKSASAVIDSDVQVIIGGSYRRGAANSGDIDCLITKRGTKRESDLLPFLDRLTNHLTNSKFLVYAVATPSKTGSKWHGCCVLPGPQKQVWRRIDFLLVPETQLGAALIYFTGDDLFNRSIRLLAGKKGWRLNQRGLYKNVMKDAQRVKVTDGELMEGADEKRIFELMGVPYRPSEHRICN